MTTFARFVIEKKYHEQLLYCKQCKNPSLFYSTTYGVPTKLMCHRCKTERRTTTTCDALQRKLIGAPLSTLQNCAAARQSEDAEEGAENALGHQMD